MAEITHQSKGAKISIYSGTHDFRGEFGMCAQNSQDWQAGWQTLGLEPPAGLPKGMMGIFYAATAIDENLEIRLPEVKIGESGTQLRWERYHTQSGAKGLLSQPFMAVVLPLDTRQSQTFDDVYKEWRAPRPAI